jgi:hypothetical protein
MLGVLIDHSPMEMPSHPNTTDVQNHDTDYNADLNLAISLPSPYEVVKIDDDDASDCWGTA